MEHESDDIIWVRDYSDTHIARLQGKKASSTSSRRVAAEAVFAKVFGSKAHELKPCGSDFAWKIIFKEPT